MTIRQFLDGLQEHIERGFDDLDKGKEATMADLGRLYCLFSDYASEHKDLPRHLNKEEE